MARTRLAVIVSHPIQHFAPWHREVAKLDGIDLRVFFCCRWGVEEYLDPDFGTSFRWDIPLLEGYPYEFLPIRRQPRRLNFLQVDNPTVDESLERFRPHVIQVFGYASRTMWRARGWALRRTVPLMLFSDSTPTAKPAWWKRPVKGLVVPGFYKAVDGAFAVGDNNRAYHLRYGLPSDRVFPGMYPIDFHRMLASVPNRSQARSEVRGRFRIPESAFVAIFCGKLVPRKRPLDVVRAAAAIGRRRSGDVWFLLVGEGRLRAKLEREIAAGGIRNIRVSGFVNQSRIPKIFAAGDVLLTPSELDPHPLVVTEGAAVGLPVIASDRIGCIGPNDTARPGVNALVYPCGDVGALLDAIKQLQNRPLLYSRMSKASSMIGASQSATQAAAALADAVQKLAQMGPR